ncbi:MAG: lipopolysaccharide biosynthesis protein, partial [Microgenomates group bacterium]
KIFFKTFAPWWELYLTVFSVIFLIWQNYALNSLIAIKKVFQAQVFLNLSNLLKTIFIFVLIFTKTANIAMILFVFGIFGPAVFFFFLFWQKRNVVYKIVKAPIRGEEFKFSYTLTYFLASQFFNLGTRMDLFLLSFYFPKTAVLGYYGLSTKIILTLFAAVSSVTQVLSPDFSKIKKYSDLKTLFKKSLLFLSIPTLLFFLLFLTPKEIFQIAFTEKFTKTVQITHLLSLAYLIYPILNIPLLFFLYTEKKPKFILIANTVFFITISLSCFYLIPKLNFYAGPLSVFLALFLSGVYLFYKFIKIIKNDRGIIA